MAESLLDLNEDCLVLIVKHLDKEEYFFRARKGNVKEKMALASTCRYLQSLVYGENFSYFWKRIEYRGLSLESFFAFLGRIQHIVHELEFNFDNYKQKMFKQFFGKTKEELTKKNRFGDVDCSKYDECCDDKKYQRFLKDQLTELSKIFPVLPSLDSFRLFYYSEIEEDAVLEFEPKMPGVSKFLGIELNLERHLQKSMNAFPNLKDADLLGYDASTPQAEQLLISFLNNKTNLTTVKLPRNLTSNVLSAWLSNAVLADKIEDLWFPFLRDSDLINWLPLCRNLEKLSCFGNGQQVTGAGLAALGSLQNLRELYIGARDEDIMGFTSDDVANLFRTARFSLHDINMDDDRFWNDDAVEALIANNPELNEIRIRGPISNHGLRNINSLHRLDRFFCFSRDMTPGFYSQLDPVQLPKLSYIANWYLPVSYRVDLADFCARFPNAITDFSYTEDARESSESDDDDNPDPDQGDAEPADNDDAIPDMGPPVPLENGLLDLPEPGIN